ncbi:MAG: helix-hairpin-helix domain-containing protein [Cyanobacterium sp. T60_A2020_053]|nr:helix-hairpin-helix domain-containing protein [Cyanobacterium sp. T60_A2020_053]
MSNNSNWFEKTPQWIWGAFVPMFGGASLIFAGWKAKTNSWMAMGGGLIVGSLFMSSIFPPLMYLIWGGQVFLAFKFKQDYLIKTVPKGTKIPSSKIAQLLAEKRGQVDINNCSKDDIVYQLGLPIIYANDLEILRREGYFFTDIDELAEVAGIPEHLLQRIEPLIVFRYDLRKETDISWRRLNSYSVEELVNHGIDFESAKKIVSERTKNGQFNSLVDVLKRTKIPINVYRHLA